MGNEKMVIQREVNARQTQARTFVKGEVGAPQRARTVFRESAKFFCKLGLGVQSVDLRLRQTRLRPLAHVDGEEAFVVLRSGLHPTANEIPEDFEIVTIDLASVRVLLHSSYLGQ